METLTLQAVLISGAGPVKVSHAKAQALHQSQAGAIQGRDNEPLVPGELGKDSLDPSTRHHHRNMDSPFCTYDFLQIS